MRFFGKGFNFGEDGPGNRLVYHLSGCNMHCIWCSNPDGMSKNAGQEITPEEIVKECISCKPMFFSNGGVTFTGGEATLWHNELLEVLKALKKEGIHTAIETNGTSPYLSELLPYIDYLIMDFKHFDNEALKQYTGVSLENVKANFIANCKSGRKQHIRIPLINGINAYNPECYAEFFTQYNTENTVFEFLSYHEYGKEKWQGEYKVKDGFITKETLTLFIKTFKDYGLKVVNT